MMVEFSPEAVATVLSRAHAGGHTPYDWLVRGVGKRARTVLDLSVDAGGARSHLAADGRDVTCLSAAALSGRLPQENGSVDAVTSVLGVTSRPDLPHALKEIARVLRPGGVLVALAPAMFPVSPADLQEVGLLVRHLKIRDTGLSRDHTVAALPAAALRKVEHRRERYAFTVADRADARALLSAIPFRSLDGTRLAAGVEHLVARIASRGPVTMPVPIRRLVAIK
ncbi:class I SAM-dependent methyltransferase [Propionibacteriaceae bacterium Y1700]|uniref:class I SAM-dependent methyltransferase n=1 Tax=Microlunatus sp. Y1700 TaxID=3418487 RepID=UPI003DA6F8DE